MIDREGGGDRTELVELLTYSYCKVTVGIEFVQKRKKPHFFTVNYFTVCACVCVNVCVSL